jgi:hypothetical protein
MNERGVVKRSYCRSEDKTQEILFCFLKRNHLLPFGLSRAQACIEHPTAFLCQIYCPAIGSR